MYGTILAPTDYSLSLDSYCSLLTDVDSYFLRITLSITSINYHNILLSLSTSADDTKIKCLYSTLAYTFIMSHVANNTSFTKSHSCVPCLKFLLSIITQIYFYHHSCVILETGATLPDSSPLWSVLVLSDNNAGATTTTTATTNTTPAIWLLSQQCTFCHLWPVLPQVS